MTDTIGPSEIVREREETIERPTKRWRNRYVTMKAGGIVCGFCGFEQQLGIGDEWSPHCVSHASKDLAEAHGWQCEDDMDTYVGAFEVDE